MSETMQMPDPRTLAKYSAMCLPTLADVFCSLKGKVALVTGGASGLGYNVVNRLAEAGASVVIASRNEEKGLNAVKDFTEKGYQVSWVKTDVSKVDNCYAAVDYAVKTYGSLDILVANAGSWASYAYLDVTEELYDKILDTDLKGEYFIGQAAARYMVEHKIPGKIVFVSSAAHLGEGPAGIGMNSYYIAAKGGVAAMTKGIAGELIQYGINVNCVAPGGMLSEGVFTQGQEAMALYGEKYQQLFMMQADNSIPYRAKATPCTTNPDEVALAVYAMCTPMANYMVGEVVNVNGGVLMIKQQTPFSFTVPGCYPGPKE